MPLLRWYLWRIRYMLPLVFLVAATPAISPRLTPFHYLVLAGQGVAFAQIWTWTREISILPMTTATLWRRLWVMTVLTPPLLFLAMRLLMIATLPSSWIPGITLSADLLVVMAVEWVVLGLDFGLLPVIRPRRGTGLPLAALLGALSILLASVLILLYQPHWLPRSVESLTGWHVAGGIVGLAVTIVPLWWTPAWLRTTYRHEEPRQPRKPATIRDRWLKGWWQLSLTPLLIAAATGAAAGAVWLAAPRFADDLPRVLSQNVVLVASILLWLMTATLFNSIDLIRSLRIRPISSRTLWALSIARPVLAAAICWLGVCLTTAWFGGAITTRELALLAVMAGVNLLLAGATVHVTSWALFGLGLGTGIATYILGGFDGIPVTGLLAASAIAGATGIWVNHRLVYRTTSRYLYEPWLKELLVRQ